MAFMLGHDNSLQRAPLYVVPDGGRAVGARCELWDWDFRCGLGGENGDQNVKTMLQFA